MSRSPSFRLGLFGSPSLAMSDGAPLSGRSTQRHRLGLLAMLARSPRVGVSRDALMAHLWPESDFDQARNLLKVSVYVLRQALGEGAVISVGDALRLGTEAVDVDTVAFESAVESGDYERAVALYEGPFLDGFFLKAAPEFDRWVEHERAQLSVTYARALESLAVVAESRGDHVESAEWWKARAAHDPFDSRVALRLMQALALSGSGAGALRHARVHATLLKEELGIEPAPEVQRLVAQLRREHEAESVPTRPTLSAPHRARAEDLPPASGSEPPDSGSKPFRPTWLGRATSAALALLAVVIVLRFWSTGSPQDPDAIAGDIARAVVREMGEQPVDPTSSQLLRPPTVSVAAWELYRRAAQPEVLRSDSAAREALALARRAVDLDPTFPGAHAVLSRLYLRVGPPEDPAMPRVDRFTRAREHAAMAVELDPSLVEAHAALGIADMSLYRFDEAEDHLRKAVSIDPKSSQAHEWLVQLYTWTGRFGNALEEARLALEVDPLSASARGELARALLLNGHCDEALAELERLRGLQPTLLRAGPIAAQCHGQQSLWDQALADISEGLSRSGSHGQARLAYLLGKAGREREATEVLANLVEENRSTGEGAFWVAMAEAGLGHLDDAFAWLDRAVDDYSLTYEIREPGFADLQADPRFRALLERVNLLG